MSPPPDNGGRSGKRLWMWLLKPVVALLALMLVFEEWLWDGLKAQLHRLSRLPGIHRLECWLGSLPPWASLCVLVVPALALLPFKLAALWALAHGHAVLGVLTLVAAKLTGTALAAYLFDLVRSNARKLAWFDAVYNAIMNLLVRAKSWLAEQPAYVWVRAHMNGFKASWQAFRVLQAAKRSVWRRRVSLARLRLAQWLSGR
jgi:hypothetical protein